MLSWPIFGVFTFSLHILYIHVLRTLHIRELELELKAGRGFVKIMLIGTGAGAEKSAIQLNGIAQGRETAHKALLPMLILRKG